MDVNEFQIMLCHTYFEVGLQWQFLLVAFPKFSVQFVQISKMFCLSVD